MSIMADVDPYQFESYVGLVNKFVPFLSFESELNIINIDKVDDNDKDLNSDDLLIYLLRCIGSMLYVENPYYCLVTKI